MRPFGCHVTILNTLDHLGKFDGKSDDGLFVGYLLNSKAFRVYNIRTRKVEENFHVRFLEDKPIIAGDGSKWLFDIDVLTKSMNYVPVIPGTNSNDFIDGSLFDSSSKNARNDEPQPSNDARKKNDEDGIDDQERPENSTHVDFFGDETKLDMSNITTTYPVPTTPNTRIHKDHSLDHVIGDDEPKKVIQALKDPSWIEAIQEELLNKKDKRGIVIRNKARMVAQGYTQEERIDYNEIEKEVYVCQPLGFKDPKFHDKVYKGGQIDKTLFIKRVKGDILLVQVYVDDIIFVSTRKEMYTQFEKMMHKRFQMSSMGELTFFLGLQTASTPMETLKPLLKDVEAEDVDVHLYRSMIGSLMYLTASRPDIMFIVCFDYDLVLIKVEQNPNSHEKEKKQILRYLKGQPKLGLWYPKDLPFDLEAYTDSDYAGAGLDRKSIIGGCQFLRSRLISWQCKKQTIIATSTTEAEYVAAASCCGKVLWIQNQMLDYRYNFMNTKIFIDNESTICIVKNPVFHSKTKHIEIRHHFIRDSNEKKCTDKTKITRKQSNTDKHGHGKWKSTKEAEKSNQDKKSGLSQ
ncbi:putative ribonuclease H-like domain-containing protein [Tanacetum coccineum]|uniref:Ribonuclease H-like domain-containing protein n=1 Tax=Tanacetum coccineum TaxID=301880 RepID=A0ABQ5EVB7_9ASTR